MLRRKQSGIGDWAKPTAVSPADRLRLSVSSSLREARVASPSGEGNHGFTGNWARNSAFGDRLLKGVQAVAENVRSDAIEKSGHWLAKEQPEALSEQLLSFFGE